jgi:hypothetical protein
MPVPSGNEGCEAGAAIALLVAMVRSGIGSAGPAG